MLGRFDKKRKRLRIAARIALGMIIGSLIILTIILKVEARRDTKDAEMAESSQEHEPEQNHAPPVEEIEVLIVFSDESETEPFAGHGTTLEEWSGLPEWDIPEEYKQTGGCLPESVRTYLYNLCEEKSISYPLMLALIEAESSYQWDAESPDGSCKGYCMIAEKWHQERMERLGVTDIYDPYGNIAVSVDLVEELFHKYGDVNIVLMCYNCGETRTAELLAEGITSTSYSRKIIAREAEISLEMYGQ